MEVGARTRSNIWNDPGQPQKAELTETCQGRISSATLEPDKTLEPNSVAPVELIRSGRAPEND